MVFHESELDWIKDRQDVVELRKAIRLGGWQWRLM